jgi:hypothetical protein
MIVGSQLTMNMNKKVSGYLAAVYRDIILVYIHETIM